MQQVHVLRVVHELEFVEINFCFCDSQPLTCSVAHWQGQAMVGSPPQGASRRARPASTEGTITREQVVGDAGPELVEVRERVAACTSSLARAVRAWKIDCVSTCTQGLEGGPEDDFDVFKSRTAQESARTNASSEGPSGPNSRRPTVSTLRRLRGGEMSRAGFTSQMMLTSSVPLPGVKDGMLTCLAFRDCDMNDANCTCFAVCCMIA